MAFGARGTPTLECLKALLGMHKVLTMYHDFDSFLYQEECMFGNPNITYEGILQSIAIRIMSHSLLSMALTITDQFPHYLMNAFSMICPTWTKEA